MPPNSRPVSFLPCLLLAIDLARSPAALIQWAAAHAHLLPRLSEAEREAATAARARRLAQLEIEAVPTLPALAAWWAGNAALLRSLPPDDLAAVVGFKDAAKARLLPLAKPPPAVVAPWRGQEARASSGRLI